MEEIKSKKQLSISRHQLALIAVIFLVLGIITWFRSSERIIQSLTQIFSKQENKVHVSIKDRPEYKKYFEPKQDVLGVTTDIEEKPGTMIEWTPSRETRFRFAYFLPRLFDRRIFLQYQLAQFLFIE
jgi:hypothetical protein